MFVCTAAEAIVRDIKMETVALTKAQISLLRMYHAAQLCRFVKLCGFLINSTCLAALSVVFSVNVWFYRVWSVGSAFGTCRRAFMDPKCNMQPVTGHLGLDAPFLFLLLSCFFVTG